MSFNFCYVIKIYKNMTYNNIHTRDTVYRTTLRKTTRRWGIAWVSFPVCLGAEFFGKISATKKGHTIYWEKHLKYIYIYTDIYYVYIYTM